MTMAELLLFPTVILLYVETSQKYLVASFLAIMQF